MNRHFQCSGFFSSFCVLFVGLGLWAFSFLTFTTPARADGDHGGSCASASFLALGTTTEATHEPGLDRDVFRLDVPAPGIVTLEIVANGGRDSRLRLRGRDCVDEQALRSLERTDLRQSFLAETTGSYYFEVAGRGARQGSPYALRSTFAADRDAVDLIYETPADPLDACSALSNDLGSTGVKSGTTDELDPVVPVPPPRLAAGGSFLLVPLQPKKSQIGGKSGTTDELDPVIPVPPPKLLAGASGRVVVLTESIDPFDTDVVLLRAQGEGYFVIDAEGAAVAGSLFGGSSCSAAKQVASGVRLDRVGALIVPAGEYVLRIEPEPEAAGRYWLRIKHLVGMGG